MRGFLWIADSLRSNLRLATYLFAIDGVTRGEKKGDIEDWCLKFLKDEGRSRDEDPPTRRRRADQLLCDVKGEKNCWNMKNIYVNL